MAIGQGNSTKIQTICQRKYESLTELIQEYDGTKVCKHGNKLSSRCQKKKVLNTKQKCENIQHKISC